MLHYNSKIHSAQIGPEIVDAWSTPPDRPPTPSSSQPPEASLPSPSGGGGGGRDDAAPPRSPTARPRCSSPSSLVAVFEASELGCGRLMPKNKGLRRMKDKKVKKEPPGSVLLKFNVDGTINDYMEFIKELREKLGGHNDTESMSRFKESQWRGTHILLPKQTAPEPARWIVITLSAEERKTTLFLRDDNVYLAGFENQKGQKYQAGRGLGGQSGRAPKKNEKAPDQILEGATSLGYDLSYDDLGSDRLRWNLNQNSIVDAVFKLSAYNKKQKCIKNYLARLIVFICEAARMHRIMTRVERGWRSYGDVYLKDIEGQTLNEWVHMSQAMMRWGDYTPGLNKIEVRNDKEAGGVVHLIKYAPMRKKSGDGTGDAPPGDGNGDEPPEDGNDGAPPGDAPGDGNGDAPPGDGNGHETSPLDGNGHGAPPGGGSGDGTPPGGGSGDPTSADRNGKSQQRRQQQGRSLLEVSSIQLTEGCTPPDVGSITVFDGKRGQIIYLNNEDGAPRVDSKGNLVLTGPYRAISAEGMVALRVTTVSDSHTAEDELLIWDPYTGDDYEDIDKLVSMAITEDEDLMLTYAVLSSAVEATVQVDLFLFKETDFFGKITAHSKLKSGEDVSVVLFSHEIKDRVVFEPSLGGLTIPLTRSVLAWAVDSELRIEVVCFHSVSVLHCGLRLRPNVGRSFEGPDFSFDDHTDKLRFATLEGFGYIRVSVDDTGEYREKPHNNSLPRSLDQLSRDQTLAAERELALAAKQNDLTRMGILERETGAQDSMGPGDIGTRPKLLVVRTSQLRLITFEHKMLTTCLLHLTNNSNNQHVAFRCRSVLEGDHHFPEYPLEHSSARMWEFSGILPPNSTSAYLVRREGEQHLLWEMGTLSLILESCVAWQDEKHVDTIFPAAGEGIEKATQSATVSEPADEAITSEEAEDDVGLDTIFGPAKERTEKVTLKVTVGDPAMRTTTSEQAKGDEDLDTFFSTRSSKGIKEATIKATVSHPADVPMTSKTETEIKVPITESSINQSDLDVYPLQLGFSFKQDKVICCPLRLTNRTDHYVIFKCLPYTTYSYLYTLDHLNGILPPRSTCTYFVAMEKQKDLPDDMDALSVILKSCKAEKIAGPGEYISSQDLMDGPIPPRIEIITVTGKDYEILSMDVHPTEPWILASHFNGNVSIWNYQTEARVMELTVPDSRLRGFGRCIYSAKFIAAEKWIVAGGGDGVIYMVKYMTKEVKKFKAHRSSVESLAVHPNKPFVLSASYDGTIKLWNWDVNRDPIWQNTRTFSGHLQVVNYVMFNPYDNGNTFASASDDFTVKIWSTNDPNDQPKPIATLKCGEVPPQHVAYYSMGGRQYMITGSLKGAARVWDLEKPNKPIKELDGLAKEKESTVSKDYGCNVGVLNCVPDDINPVLITVSGDKGISFLDATTYKPRYDKVNFGLGVAMGFAVIDVKGKRSLAIALREGIAIMEMNEDQVNSPATVEQAQEGIYSAESSNDQ